MMPPAGPYVDVLNCRRKGVEQEAPPWPPGEAAPQIETKKKEMVKKIEEDSRTGEEG